MQFSAAMSLCSKQRELVSGLLKVGELSRGSGTPEAVAASSKLISSTVGEQVSLDYAKGWCRSRHPRGKVKCAPNHLTAVKLFFFF